MNLQGSKTEQNIIQAFIGESIARMKYTFYAGVANKEGFKKVAAIFEETANHERAHAKSLFNQLTHKSEHGIIVPEFKLATTFATTSENLLAAAKGENYEQTDMYPQFAKIAKEEGFNDIAKIFESIAESEKFHEKRFLELKKQIDEGTMFANSEEVIWRCRNCGYHTTEKSSDAPHICPACAHPQAHFERA
jgi:rubrerythrin